MGKEYIVNPITGRSVLVSENPNSTYQKLVHDQYRNKHGKKVKTSHLLSIPSEDNPESKELPESKPKKAKAKSNHYKVTFVEPKTTSGWERNSKKIRSSKDGSALLIITGGEQISDL